MATAKEQAYIFLQRKEGFEMGLFVNDAWGVDMAGENWGSCT